MATTFMARSAEGYEQIMGRWSRRLAPKLIEFAGVEAGDRVLDVGCGTGSLTAALAGHAELAAVTTLDAGSGRARREGVTYPGRGIGQAGEHRDRWPGRRWQAAGCAPAH